MPPDNHTHKSDCAVHNEPAYPNGPCDCRELPTDWRRELEALAELDCLAQHQGHAAGDSVSCFLECVTCRARRAIEAIPESAPTAPVVTLGDLRLLDVAAAYITETSKGTRNVTGLLLLKIKLEASLNAADS
jgi:hypothetical protein